MADETSRDSSSSFPYWIPTVVGVGIGARRAWQSIASGELMRPTLASNVREATLAAQQAIIGTPIQKFTKTSYEAMLTSLMESQSWRRMGESKARNVIAEATRVSLLKGNRMNMYEVNEITRNILGKLPFEGDAVNQDMFAVAAGHVRKAGDLPTFMNIMRHNKNFSTFFSREEIEGIQGAARTSNRLIQAIQGGPAYHVMPKGPITFFDIETGGFKGGTNPLLEIGIRKVNPITGEVIRTYEAKVAPWAGSVIDEEAAKLIGYTPEKWAGAKPVEQVLKEIAPLLEGEIVAGHNIGPNAFREGFDINFLQAEFKRAGLTMPKVRDVIDTMNLGGGQSLENLSEALGIPRPAAHSAMGDAINTAEVYKSLTRELNDKADWWKVHVSANERALLDNLFEISGNTSRLAVRGLTKIPGQPTVAELSIMMNELGRNVNFPLNVTLDPRLSLSASARNVTSRVILPGAQAPISFPEYFGQQLGTELIPEVTQLAEQYQGQGWIARRAIKDRINDFNAKMSRMMTYVANVNHPSVAIATALNQDIVAAPHLGKGWAGPQINTDAELGDLIRKGLYPYSSKRIAEGKLLSWDPRSLWLYGSSFPLTRQPAQFVARGWTPSERALRAMRENPLLGGLTREVPFAMTAQRARFAELGMKSPQMLTMYAIGGPSAQALAATGLEADQLLLRKRMTHMFESEAVRTVRIGLEEGIDRGVANWIKSNTGATNVSPMLLAPGQGIGREVGTGTLKKAAAVSGVTERLIGVQISGKEAILSLKETADIRGGQVFKVFGSSKATVTQGAPGQFKGVAQTLENPLLASGIDAIAYVDELRKNQALLREQMSSALNVFSRMQLQRGNIAANLVPEVTSFLEQPLPFIQRNLQTEMDILRTAGRWGLTKEQIQLIGGGAEAAGFLTPAELEEARKLTGGSLIHKSGAVVGLATGYVGEFEQTIGTTPMRPPRGSMEPRALMQLLQHQWPTAEGDAAKLLAGEIASRMRGYGGDIREISRALESLTGKLPEGVKTVRLSDLGRGVEMASEGYAVDLGMNLAELGGTSTLYVPPDKTLQRFKKIRARQGKVIGTDLVRSYDRVISAVRRVQNEGDSVAAQKQLNESSKHLAKTLQREAGAAMYGRGAASEMRGALRQRFAGGMYAMFENVNTAYNAVEQDVAYASEALGKRMFEDQLRGAKTEEMRAFLKEQKTRFLSGEKVAGFIRRDPAIGPYSLGLTWIQKAKDIGTERRYFIQTPTKQLSTMVEAAGLGQFQISTAATLGLAADYDADRGVISFISGHKTSKAVEEMLTSGRYRKEYMEFAMQAGTLKKLLSKSAELPGLAGRAGQSQVSFENEVDQLIFEAQKLKVVKTGTPVISSVLNEAKLAMAAYKPERSAMFNIFAETLEQFPISGKHIKSAGDVKMAEELASYISGIGAPSGAEFENLVARTEELYGQELAQGIAIKDLKSGAATTLRINPREMWSEVRDALSQGKAPGGIVHAWRTFSRDSKLAENMSVSSFTELFKRAQQGGIDDLSLLAMREVTDLQSGAIISQNSLLRINETIKRAGAKAREWGKPALIGLAITAATAMITGGPKGQVVQGPMPTERHSKSDMQAGDERHSNAMLNTANQMKRQMNPESLSIPSRTRADAPAMRSLPPKTIRLDTPSANNSRIVVDAEMDNAADRQQLSKMLKGVTGRDDIRLQYSDNRRKMTSSDVEDILEGY